MKLTDPWFEACFYGRVTPDGSYHHLDSIEEAQGVFLWCPCGYGKPEYPLDGARPHGLLIPFANPRNAPSLPENHGPSIRGNPSCHPRWSMSGNGLHDLTITPSVDVGISSCWHGFITNGDVT